MAEPARDDPARDDPAPFVHRIRPRFSEVDLQGVVFFGNWLDFFDDALTRYLDSLGLDPQPTFSTTFDMMVVRAVVDWTGSARFDDVVDIEVRPLRLGRSSLDFGYRATVAGRPACEATITYVSVVPGSGGSCPVPGDVRALLRGRGATDTTATTATAGPSPREAS